MIFNKEELDSLVTELKTGEIRHKQKEIINLTEAIKNNPKEEMLSFSLKKALTRLEHLLTL